MRIIESFEEVIAPSILAMGVFDGVHRGHQMLIRRLCVEAKASSLLPIVFTFTNHPAHILAPQRFLPLLARLDQRLQWLEELGVKAVIALPFTFELAALLPREFLLKVRAITPFASLILGEGAVFGRDRLGTSEVVASLGSEMGFKVEYLPPFKIDGEVASSTKVRSLVMQGNFQASEKWLGRKFAVRGEVIRGKGLGKGLGFPTANISLEPHACLPPRGVYIVEVFYQGRFFPAVANLGVAPTFTPHPRSVLEVHILEPLNSECYGATFDVFFHSFIRFEAAFASQELLQQRIAADIECANYFFNNLLKSADATDTVKQKIAL